MEFSEWITRKYVEWRGNAVGRERSITDFAQYIDVTQPTMSGWMNGSIPKRHEMIVKLVNVYGPEVFAVLGLDQPDPIFDELHRLFYKMTPEQRDRYLGLARNILSEDES